MTLAKPGLAVLSRVAPNSYLNLCLVFSRRTVGKQDLDDIVSRLRRKNDRILVNLVSPIDTADAIPAQRWNHPSVTVALCLDSRFVPRRGPVFECLAIPKLEQYRVFRESGIATPRTERFELGRPYPAEDWSEFAILKPLSLTMTSKSGKSQLIRTARLPALSSATLPEDHFLRQGPALVQEFVDTGLHPNKWRVLSFLGEPLYSSMTRSAAPRVALDASDEEIESSLIDAKNPKSKLFDPENRRNRLIVDNDVLDFARRIHRAFPKRPLLGVDILKRESDGALFALEINAGGNVWHFSSVKEGHRNRLGGKDAMVNQLGAWDRAADALIRHTLAHAV